MIQILSTIVTIWAWGVPVAGIVFGFVVSGAPAQIRWSIMRRHYVFWCIAWPMTAGVLAFRFGRLWWNR